MAKITLDNIFDNKKCLSILEELNRYPDGLRINELKYLLSNSNVQHISDLQSRFGKNRRNIFKGKDITQKIYAHLKTLRFLDVPLVIREDKKYKIPHILPDILSLYANSKILERHLERIKVILHGFYETKEDNSSKLQIDAISIHGIDIYGLFLLGISDKKQEKINQAIFQMKSSFEELISITNSHIKEYIDKQPLSKAKKKEMFDDMTKYNLITAVLNSY